MISASREFKEKLKSGANVVNYADITLSDGTVLHLEPKDFMIGGCSVDDKTTDGKFGVGFVTGKTLTLRIANHDERFSQYDFYESIINLYVAIAMDDGRIEKIRKGKYYATVPSTAGDIIEISAVDGIFKFDRDYANSRTSYPATLQTIISDACLDCGIPMGFRQFDNMNFIVSEKPENVTYRQVVSYASQIAGYNARIDNDGYMQLVWYDTDMLMSYYNGGDFKIYPHDTVVDGGNFTDYSTDLIISGGNFTDLMPEHIFRVKSLDIHTDDVLITGVRVIGEDDATALFGEEGYLIEVSGNPFTYGQEESVADYIGNRVVGIAFRPFSAQILNNPLYEPFEIVTVSDKRGNVYTSIVNSVSYKVGGYTQVSCQAEDPVRNGSSYFSEAAAAVVQARRNAEKQLTTYDKAVQNMNQIAMNAMGYHITYEDQPDGSRITYLHDKPTLEESTIIYKQTIDGFFISTDGGKSYTAGFDKNGNAVVNILYAIGIVCDWIRGGTLTLGGADNVNGKLQVLDAKGNIICQITKDGLISQFGNLNDDIDGINSHIEQINSSITAEVTRATKAEGELSAKITVTEQSITTEVKRATSAENSLFSRITQNADGITAEVTRATAEEGKLSSVISAQAEQIKLKVTKGDISSEISQEAGKISIKSNRISIDSTYFKLTEDGKISATEVDLSGKIKATSGKIAGFAITGNSMYSGKTNIDSDSVEGVYIGNDGISVGISEHSCFKVKSTGGVEIDGYIDVKSGNSYARYESAKVTVGHSKASTFSEMSIDHVKVVGASSSNYAEMKFDEINLHGSSSASSAVLNHSSLTVSGTKYTSGGITFSSTATITALSNAKISIVPKFVVLGTSGGNLGFFGGNGSLKKTVSKITASSSTTVSNVADKVNDLIDALRAYDLIG